MSNAAKNAVYTIVLLSLIGCVWAYRTYVSAPPKALLVHYRGKTMGVINYNVKYLGQPDEEVTNGIDRLLKEFNNALSTYIPDSEISRFNKSRSIAFESGFFQPVLAKSAEVWEKSDGAFDPTVMPLLRFWGFGAEKNVHKDTTKLDSLRSLVGFEMIRFNEDRVTKSKDGVELDFGAIAKGYAVDLVSEFLSAHDFKNHFVEIGGEVVSRGHNNHGKTWTVGIRNPWYKSGGNHQKAIIKLPDGGMATSGNYENYYEEKGQKYVHTINPKTGLAQPGNLLSATVISQDCMTADAWATAFMVLGFEKSKEILARLPHVEAYFIYDHQGSLRRFYTEGFKSFLVDEAL